MTNNPMTIPPPMTNDQPTNDQQDREGFSEAESLYEPQIYKVDPPPTNDLMTNDSMTIPPPMTNDFFYIPYQHYRTIDEEIDGLTFLAKHQPEQFTRANEHRLQMLKKSKARCGSDVYCNHSR